MIMETYEQFKIGGHTLFSRNGRPWRRIIGYVIASRGKFYAYNSFRCQPYLSNLDHSEVFQNTDSANKWMEKYGVSGELVVMTSRDSPGKHFENLLGF